MKQKPRKLWVNDTVKVTEQLYNYKRWFNGIKRFIAIRFK